jgi:hypothetical protein
MRAAGDGCRRNQTLAVDHLDGPGRCMSDQHLPCGSVDVSMVEAPGIAGRETDEGSKLERQVSPTACQP